MVHVQRKLRFLGFSAILGMNFLFVSAQSSSPILGDIPIPIMSGVLGQQDAVALQEIKAHIAALGAGSWLGMQGTGQIVYGSKDSTAYTATLSILGTTGFRLDSKTATGETSTRIYGRYGTIQEADGRKYPLPSNTAISGIVQFPQLRLVGFPASGESLIDRGLVTVDGASLHRVTVECSASTRNQGAVQGSMVATDFYFDPATHLLLKSVNKIRLSGTGNSDFLRVVAYEDYRQVSGGMIPFRYVQTLDGNKQWTLQLSDVQLNPALIPTYFAF
jgi:hypothetical protein